MAAPAADVDPLVALVESWDTFLVPKATEKDASGTSPAAFDLAPHRYYLNDTCEDVPPHCGAGTSDQEGQRSAEVSGAAASLLWLLTLVSRNVELLRAAAHLFLQFNSQYAALVESGTASVNVLRAHHQHQLASLLEVADNHATADMIVDSAVTERVVLQQQAELDAAERRCVAAEQQLEAELQETLWRFLSTSAPDAVAAANRKEQQTLDCADGSSGSGGGNGSYRAEVDVSRFAEVRKSVSAHQRRSDSAVAPYSPVRMVPVRTIRLSNEVGAASAAAAAASPRAPSKRSQDAALQPIVLDVSPVSALRRCLACCSGTQAGAIASSVSSAAEEHLLRLAYTRHSVLLLIGTEAAAMGVLGDCTAPELLLGPGHSCRDRFQPLPNHAVLRVLFTTRLWGANVVLLWNPVQTTAPAAAAAAVAQPVVEDALALAYAWDADMFSVAVLDGVRLPGSGAAGAAGGGGGLLTSAAASGPSAASVSAAFLASQSMSMEVLRQLRNGVTREMLETAGARRPRRWQGTATWMQQGIGSAAAAVSGAHMCPRAVGALYASHAAPPSPEARRPNAASPPRGSPSVVSAGSSSPLSTPASPTAAFRGPPITFNTPLAIRVFLPLGEEYFIRDRADAVRGYGGYGSSGDGGGGQGARANGGAAGTAGTATAPRSADAPRERGGSHDLVQLHLLPTTASEEDEEEEGYRSFRSDEESRFVRGSFSRSTTQAPPSAVMDAVGTGAGGVGDHGVRRPREVMNLESLIQYAFGDFAETI
ncbi:hypothetical protein NESM_000132600 [Novymonas esmeraldas]|uniref:Uncharacterized protein n=1 Tax=Novymonas esmeraldas TaxID=1808958 RepID=A0AAW0F3L7_9TRYP